jgi:hypothetical protein
MRFPSSASITFLSSCESVISRRPVLRLDFMDFAACNSAAGETPPRHSIAQLRSPLPLPVNREKLRNKLAV